MPAEFAAEPVTIPLANHLVRRTLTPITYEMNLDIAVSIEVVHAVDRPRAADLGKACGRLVTTAQESQLGLLAHGKATAFVGPAVLAWVTAYWGSQRAGMATILVFFAAGMALLWPLEESGR